MTEEEETLQTYQKIARRWKDKHPKLRFWEEELQELVKIRDSGSLIDVGCGYGRDSIALREAGFDYLGIDFSSEMINVAKDSFPEASFKVGDMYDLKEFGSFDVIWAVASLVHIPKDKAHLVLEQFKMILNPEGVAVISLKSGNKEVMEDFEGNPTTRRFMIYWDKDKFENLAKEYGFEVLKVKDRQAPDFYWHTFYLKMAS